MVSLSLRFSKDVMDTSTDAMNLGATRLPPQERPSQVIAFDIEADYSRVMGAGNAFLDITVWSEGAQVAYWPGAQWMTFG